MEKLYIKNINREKNDTLYSFILKCINHKKLYKSEGQFPKTYLNKECTIKECNTKFRSFEVILSISNSYFLNVTEKKVALILKKIMQETNMRFLFCTHANKWIFYKVYSWWKDSQLTDHPFLINYNSSINKVNEKGSGEYTFNQLLELMEEDIIK